MRGTLKDKVAPDHDSIGVKNRIETNKFFMSKTDGEPVGLLLNSPRAGAGLWIIGIVPFGLAYKAHLEVGDRVDSINGTKVTSATTASEILLKARGDVVIEATRGCSVTLSEVFTPRSNALVDLQTALVDCQMP